MKRTLTIASVVSLPTRRTTPSWITRNSFAWIGLDISISSSKNSVPPCQVGRLVARLARHEQGVHRPADEDLEMGGREGLREVVPCPLAQRIHARVDARVARHHDADGVAVRGEGGTEQGQAVDLRHVEVHEQDIEGAALDEVERFLTAPTE